MNPRALAAVLLGMTLLATGSPAQALEWPKFTTPKQEPRFSIDVRFGSYRPRMASDASHPAKIWFDSYFAEGIEDGLFGHGPIMKQIELEYYFTHIFGRIGAAVSVGHWDIGSKAKRCYENQTDAAGDTTQVYVDCSSNPDLIANGQTEEGSTPTSLVVVPISLSAVYRADQLMRQFDIPLMPYVKAGFDMGLWWSRAGGSTATGVDTDGNEGKGEGISFGWHATLGLAINLDWLDPTNSGTDESTIGFVGSYIFIEGTYLGGDTFGTDPNERLDLTDFSAYIGLTLDFE